MPPYLHTPNDATAPRHRAGDAAPSTTPPPKRNHSFLSLLLKPLIMILITTIFFLFLGFAALVLFHLCLVGGFLHRHRTHQTHQLATPHPPPPLPRDALSPRDVRRLPKFKNDAASRDPCAVCLDGFRRDQWCRKLSGCGHVFHRSCVDTWLIKVASCPICRTRVRAEPESTGWRLGGDQGGYRHFPTFRISTAS